MELASPLPPRVRKSNTRLGLIVTALIVLVAGYGAVKTSAFQWFILRMSLRSQFPNVQWISVSALGLWLDDHERQQPILLDVRTASEWNVSHLPGARRIEPGVPVETAFPGSFRQAPVVTYCAVGFRSAEVASRLRAAGFTDVQSLEGGIFEWANQHRPLVQDGKRASRVHPYNEFWARLLSKDLRAPYN